MNYSSDGNVSLDKESFWRHVLSGYRSLFYLWTPSETSFANVDDVPSYVDKVSNEYFN